jgi:two-component system nitrogen regulation sensor histidine kinase NtrY
MAAPAADPAPVDPPVLAEAPGPAPAPASAETGRRRRFSLAGKLTAVGAVALLAAIGLGIAVDHGSGSPALAVAIAALVGLVLWAWLVARVTEPVVALFRALAGTVTSYRDGDFSFSLRWDGSDELADLVDAHNALGAALRDERLTLVQRELLLDTMIQHTPVAMVLVGAGGHIVYANLAARRLLHGGRRLEGMTLAVLLESAPRALRDAVERGGDGLFTVGAGTGDGEDDEVYHLARRGFRLNGRAHELFLMRHLTTELRRQEVQTWKKVIRVISHELNNSLAPVASLAHSGAELVRRGQHDRLAHVFATIEDRARHLDGFIQGYAKFAKLPSPRSEPVAWAGFLAQLREQIEFAHTAPPPDWIGRFDRAQLEQAVINLVKNAHESGSAPDAVELRLRRVPGWFRLEVLDRGSGMSDATLVSALVPFYSTKRTGTGLGLPLAREIVEAHGGQIAIANRADGGGLVVTLVIPE